MLRLGLIGTVLTALCCFTPLLPWLLGSLGLTVALPYLYNDVILLPLLAGFVALSGYSFWRNRQK